MSLHKHNFFKNTYCEFEIQELDFFEQKKVHFKSKSGSYYFYTEEGVYRYSNHWGRVATCRWKIKGIEEYKSQNYYVGYSKWINFYPLNNFEKVFFLEVDFEVSKAKIIRIDNKDKDNVFLMNFSFALNRLKQIQTLFKEYKWACYYDEDIHVLRKKLIKELISTNKNLQQLKKEL